MSNLLKACFMKNEEKDVFLDTTILNLLCKNNISCEDLEMAIKEVILSKDGFRFYVSSVQHEELKKTSDTQLKNLLLAKFSTLPLVKAAPPFMVGVPGAGIGEGEVCGSKIFPELEPFSQELIALNQELKGKRRREKADEKGFFENHYADVSAAYSSLKNNLLLVTADINLTMIAAKHKIKVIQYHKGTFYFYKALYSILP